MSHPGRVSAHLRLLRAVPRSSQSLQNHYWGPFVPTQHHMAQQRMGLRLRLSRTVAALWLMLWAVESDDVYRLEPQLRSNLPHHSSGSTVLQRRRDTGLIGQRPGLIPRRQRSVASQMQLRPPELWEPTPQHPVPVHHVFNYTQSGLGGLNNILWADVRALQDGCRDAKKLQKERAGSFAAVLLPPLYSDLTHRTKSHRPPTHPFSDLFDMAPLAKAYRDKYRCFVSDQKGFQRLIETGAVVLAGDAQYTGGRPPGRTKAVMGPHQTELYGHLELSNRLMKKIYRPCLQKMHSEFGNYGPILSVHMRVEDDWVDKYCSKWQGDMPEDAFDDPNFYRGCFGAAEIANISLSAPELREYTNVLMIYAADKFMQAGPTAKRHPSLRVDPKEAWPAHVTATSASELECFPADATYTERSVVSMFLAAGAEAFVGFIQSTMSTGLVQFRKARGKLSSSYFYDCKSVRYKRALSPRKKFVYRLRNIWNVC